jgi:O-antigen/teichoic acid export membrane protein
VAKNALILMTLNIAVPAFSLVLVFAISRLLGTEGLGRYTLVLSYFNLFTMLTPLGLNVFLVREGVRDFDRLSMLLSNAVMLGVGSSLISMAFMILLGGFFGYDDTTYSALVLLSFGILPSTLLVYFESTFVAYERFEYIAASSLVELVVRVGCAVFLLAIGYGIKAVVMAFVGSRLLACLLAWALLYRVQVQLQWRIDRSMLHHLLQAAPTFLGMHVFATLYWRVDTVMLSILRPLGDVGYYGAAYRLTELTKILPQSLSRALYPQITQAAKSAPQQLGPLGGMALRYLWVALLPVATGCTVLAEPIMILLYGEAFRPAATTLTVLMWTVVPYAYVRYATPVFVAADQQRINLRLNAMMVGLNVLLNLVLIPRYGPLGAALTTSLSVGLFAVGQYIYLRRYLPDYMPQFPALLQPIIATVVMGGFVWWCRELHLLFVIAMAVVIYVGILLFSRYFTADELRVLRLSRVLAR